MSLIYKAQTGADFQKIADLAAMIWTEHYTAIIGSEQVNYMLSKYQSAQAMKEQVKEGAAYFILSYEGTDVGYFSYIKKKNALFLSKLYVLHGYRGKGIGKEAMLFMEKKAEALGCQNISLTVNKYNTGSIRAYKKMGFKQVDAIVTDIGSGFVMDDYLLEKKLA